MSTAPKNRRTIITELFKAFDKLEEFEYSEDQLWDFFNACVQDKNIKLKKLSKERDSPANDGSGATKTKGKTGYQHFLSEFKGEIPEGMKKREFKTIEWNALSEEERNEWKQKAKEINALDESIQKKSPSSVSSSGVSTKEERLAKWKEDMMEWNKKDPESRGPPPVMIPKPSPEPSPKPSPKSSPESSNQSSPKSSNENSPKSSNENSPKSSPEASNENSPVNTEEEHKLNADIDDMMGSDASDNEDDEESASDSEGEEEGRMEWLKDYISNSNKEWKINKSSHFKAWVLFKNPDQFGPDKDNDIPSKRFGEFKQQYDYATLKDDSSAPWHEFLIQNDILTK